MKRNQEQPSDYLKGKMSMYNDLNEKSITKDEAILQINEFRDQGYKNLADGALRGYEDFVMDNPKKKCKGNCKRCSFVNKKC